MLSATARSASVTDWVAATWAALAARAADAAAEIVVGSAAAGRRDAAAGSAAARAIPAAQRKPRVVRAGSVKAGMKIRRSGTWVKALERAGPGNGGAVSRARSAVRLLANDCPKFRVPPEWVIWPTVARSLASDRGHIRPTPTLSRPRRRAGPSPHDWHGLALHITDKRPTTATSACHSRPVTCQSRRRRAGRCGRNLPRRATLLAPSPRRVDAGPAG